MNSGFPNTIRLRTIHGVTHAMNVIRTMIAKMSQIHLLTSSLDKPHKAERQYAEKRGIGECSHSPHQAVNDPELPGIILHKPQSREEE